MKFVIAFAIVIVIWSAIFLFKDWRFKKNMKIGDLCYIYKDEERVTAKITNISKDRKEITVACEGVTYNLHIDDIYA